MRFTLIFGLIVVVLCAFHPPFGQKTDRLGVKGPLPLNGKSFVLSSSEQPASGVYIQKYFPAGSSGKDYSEKLTLQVSQKNASLRDAVKNKVAELNERKKKDPSCNYNVTERGSSETVIDYLVSEGKGDLMTAIELHVCRIRTINLGGKTATMSYTYTQRSKDMMNFFRNLRTERTRVINMVMDARIPSVKISN